MFRYEIPIDDWDHAVALTGDPVGAAAAAGPFGVEFWAEHTDGAPEHHRLYHVFGTGHLLPDGAKWIGTCPRTEDGFVWHLFDVTAVTR
jgi:hypothetical protein